MAEQSSRWTNWRYWRFDRPTARRWALLAMFIGSLGILLVSFFPGQHHLGPITLSLRSFRNPSRLMMISFAVWYALTDSMYTFLLRARDLAVVDWHKGSWLRRGLLALAGVQLYFLAEAWSDYPHHVIRVQTLTENMRTEPTNEYQLDKIARRNLENFAIECRQDLPSDARILFHGHIEGMIFAYEVYPCRVFMLPQEYGDIARTWHEQSWLKGMPDDPLEKFWQSKIQSETVDRDQFLREHHISHEVWFSEDDLTACRWRKLQ